jgi:AraC-like DNA-binding protein
LPTPDETAALRAIDVMRGNLGEPLTLDDLAAAANFSKFHFSRMFLQATGVPPHRFLIALRLQKAKELFLTTDWTVVDVSVHVGYASVGTFTTRFCRSVGLSPTAYRRGRGFATGAPHAPGPGSPSGNRVEGRVLLPPGQQERRICVGLFPGRVAEGRPISTTMVDPSGRYALDAADEDDGHVIAFSTTTGEPAGAHALVGEQTRWVATRPVAARRHPAPVDLRLEQMSRLDLPILVAIPGDRPGDSDE